MDDIACVVPGDDEAAHNSHGARGKGVSVFEHILHRAVAYSLLPLTGENYPFQPATTPC